MKRFLFIAIMLIISGISYASEKDSIEINFNEAVNAYNRQDYKNALNIALNLKDRMLKIVKPNDDKYLQIIYIIVDIYANRMELDKGVDIIADAIYNLYGKNNSKWYDGRSLLMQLGHYDIIIGDYSKALDHLTYAKLAYESIGDTESSDYACCLYYLGNVFQHNNDYIWSDILFHHALEVYEKQTKISPQRNFKTNIVILNNQIALNYFLEGNKETAMACWKGLIEKSNDVDATYNSEINYAYAASLKGEYQEAISMGYKALKHDLTDIEKEQVYQSLIFPLYITKDSRAIDAVENFSKLCKKNIAEVLSNFSEGSRENFWYEQSTYLQMVSNLIAWRYPQSNILEKTYNNILYTKNMLLRFTQVWNDLMHLCNDEPTQRKYLKMKGLKEKLISRYTPKDSLSAYRDSVDYKQMSLIRLFPNYTDIVFSKFRTCQQINRMLNKDEVAIEFSILPNIISGNSYKELFYDAMIIRKGYEHPLIVKLCNCDSLSALVDKSEMEIGDDEYANSLYKQNNESLYNLLIRPLTPYLHEGDTIYYSPSGYINNVNIMAITHGSHTMDEEYTFREVSSTSYISEVKTNSSNNDFISAGLYGGIDYDTETIKDGKEGHTRSSWENLAGSSKETAAIDSILSIHKIKVNSYSGYSASESSLRTLSGQSPSILHFATHGYFIPDETEKPQLFHGLHEYVSKDKSMQLSGLLLSGANNTWNGTKIQPDNNDGILSAAEISNLDLSGTKLAVLSACDTGLGDVDYVNGIFGLQRGLKMAGVQTIIMSLWKVPDEETSLMMTTFYENLFIKGFDRFKAFCNAVKMVRQKYPNPYNWAGFIMLD